MLKLIFALIAVAVAVPAGGLLAGVDRRLTARLQSRQGPPLLQPFYDVLKLFGKAPCVTNPWLIFSSYVCLMASAIALLMFFMQGDMLLLFFVMTVGAVFKVAGALSADSPYSNVGAQRELLQMLAYEPLVILTFVGMSAATGSFMISDIYALDVPLLPHLLFGGRRILFFAENIEKSHTCDIYRKDSKKVSKKTLHLWYINRFPGARERPEHGCVRFFYGFRLIRIEDEKNTLAAARSVLRRADGRCAGSDRQDRRFADRGQGGRNHDRCGPL